LHVQFEQCVTSLICSFFLYIEVIKEVKTDGPNLDKLLDVPFEYLEDNCLANALVAAVEYSSLSNIEKLILHGAPCIDKALGESRRLQRHAVTAFLLIIEAAIENDRNFVLKLYGEDLQEMETKIQLTEDDDLSELQRVVCSQTIKTVVPIEMSRRFRASAVREELLLRTDADKDNGIVDWSGLRLMQLEISWLQKVDWVKILTLVKNDFTALPPEMGIYLKQCTKIDLQHNKLREIPSCLLELPSIVDLNLSRNHIVEFPDVPKWSVSLSVLDLSYNSLKSLPTSAVAPNLKSLNISYNQFRSFPQCITTFIELTTLNISHNSKIRVLPSEIHQLENLTSFDFDGIKGLRDPFIVQK